jgi:hypothetical protein
MASQRAESMFGSRRETGMEVLTIKVLPHLPPLYAQDQEADPLVLCTFFPPDSTWTWYAFECDRVDILYGLVMGVEQELGSFLLSEVGQARGPLRLPLERDIHFKPTRLSEVRTFYRECSECVS